MRAGQRRVRTRPNGATVWGVWGASVSRARTCGGGAHIRPVSAAAAPDDRGSRTVPRSSLRGLP
eukprot:5662938-Prymnesium_polylepis.2